MAIIARIDFAQLLRDLDALGLSPVAVADELSRMLGERVARSTPYRWIEGSEPLHTHGAALVILHSERIRIRHGETATAQSRARNDQLDQGAHDEQRAADRQDRKNRRSG